MKTIILFLISFNVIAAEFGLEQGQSVSVVANPKYYTSATYNAFTVRSSGPLYAEYIQGGWHGESQGRFLGGSFGYRTSGRFFVDASFGGIYLLLPHPYQLDGRKQFLVSAGFGYKYENVFISAKVRHISNGAAFRPGGDTSLNGGFDVLPINVSVLF